MKKRLNFIFFILMTVLLLAVPFTANATAADVYYDLGDGFKLYIGALVCKIADCLHTGEASDWYNYSITSENVAGDSGLGQTLVVASRRFFNFSWRHGSHWCS